MYKVDVNTCNCHRETCSCKTYKITVDGRTIATGNDYVEMQILADLANRN